MEEGGRLTGGIGGLAGSVAAEWWRESAPYDGEGARREEGSHSRLAGEDGVATLIADDKEEALIDGEAE